MAHLISSTVYIAGIPETDILDYAGQGNISNLDSQVKMIGHEAVCMNAMLVFLYTFLEKKKELTSILLVKKNILTGIATKDDMITSTGIMESWFSSHEVLLNSIMPICQA